MTLRGTGGGSDESYNLNAASYATSLQNQLITNMVNMVRAPVNFITGSLVHCNQFTITIAGIAFVLVCILVLCHIRPLVFTWI